jgi:hypothetical protein
MVLTSETDHDGKIRFVPNVLVGLTIVWDSEIENLYAKFVIKNLNLCSTILKFCVKMPMYVKLWDIHIAQLLM